MEMQPIDLNDWKDNEVIKRHGSKLYVMGQDDFHAFRDFLKNNYPDVYEAVKQNCNFRVSPIDYKFGD